MSATVSVARFSKYGWLDGNDELLEARSFARRLNGLHRSLKPRRVPGVADVRPKRRLPEVAARKRCRDSSAVIISPFAAQTIGPERFRRHPTRPAGRQN